MRQTGVTDEEHEWLAEQFEAERRHLRAVAYRMLGSVTEADDAVQETWLRLRRSATSDIENLGPSLRTVVARVCLSWLHIGSRSRFLAFTVTAGKIVEIDVFVDPERIRQVDLASLLADAPDRVDR